MYKVVVVEDEEIARKGIIFTINWDALNCMIAGEAANGEEGAAVIPAPVLAANLSVPAFGSCSTMRKLPGSFFPLISEKQKGLKVFQVENSSMLFSSRSSSV